MPSLKARFGAFGPDGWGCSARIARRAHLPQPLLLFWCILGCSAAPAQLPQSQRVRPRVSPCVRERVQCRMPVSALQHFHLQNETQKGRGAASRGVGAGGGSTAYLGGLPRLRWGTGANWGTPAELLASPLSSPANLQRGFSFLGQKWYFSQFFFLPLEYKDLFFRPAFLILTASYFFFHIFLPQTPCWAAARQEPGAESCFLYRSVFFQSGVQPPVLRCDNAPAPGTGRPQQAQLLP